MRIHDIITFANENYDVNYAENSRETFRKKALHHFRTAAIVEDNAEATNSPNYKWRLTSEFLEVIRNIDVSNDALTLFKRNHSSLITIYASKKSITKMPVKINGSSFTFEKSKTYRFYLVDGTFMAVYANQNLNSNGHRKQVTILFDTNGPKGANKLGNDIYKLEYMIESLKKPKQYIGKILPQYVDYKRTDLLSNKNEMCNKNQNGVACLSLIYNDGWVFAKDYPW